MSSSSEAVPLAVNFAASQSNRPAAHLRPLGGTFPFLQGSQVRDEAPVKVSPEGTVLKTKVL